MQKYISRQVLLSDLAILLYLALLTILIHFLTNGGYGYFRDEFYYMACGEHLAWGYVDQPPFAALMVFVTRHLLGDSLFALRFFPAICGGLIVLLTGLMVRELGGGRFAQGLAAVAVIVAPVYLAIDNFFSMNCFDHVFWALAGYIVIRIVKEDKPWLWVFFGLVAGVGLMNKYSIGFLGLGIVVGLALTPARRQFLSKWIWVAGAIAFVIFLPHILWEIHNRFPTLEFIHNATVRKNLPQTPRQFMAGSVIEMHPLTAPIWLAGLAFFFLAKAGKPYRLFGWVYVSILALFLLTRAKPYYLSPAYLFLFAGGAVVIEAFVQQRNWNWLKPASFVLLLAGGAAMAPYVLPVLPVETYLKYQDFIGFKPATEEKGKLGKLPQQYADMFGWENMVATVAKVYNSLSPEEQQKCVIGASNYGEAGAIDFFGKRYGLPHAISSHNNYWIWGPGEKPGEIAIIVGGNPEEYHGMYEDVQQAATVTSEYGRPFETNLPVYLCRRPKVTLQQVWPHIKNFG
jgi:4-amino-4-deoxy-L-arabinose transferase-like glycosyltransferase